jgi:hypothetical protein
VGSMPDPKSICPSRKPRVPEGISAARASICGPPNQAMCGIPWAGTVFDDAVRPDVLTTLLYLREQLNRREEANHVARTARQ